MTTIHVAAAIIHNDEGKILAAQRGYGDFKGLWEFPGGKIEAGETPEKALKRELYEELGINVDIDNLVSIVEYDYPHFHLSMACYNSRIISGKISLKEHDALMWLAPHELSKLSWLPADEIIIKALIGRP